MSKGLFITLEGPDGAGKTTQMDNLAAYLAQRGRSVERTREPGGTRLAEAIRQLLLKPGYGRRLGTQLVEQINNLATANLKPDLTLLLDVPVEIGLRRRPGGADRMEQENLEFHRRVRQGYLELARREPRRVRLIDGTRSPEAVWAEIQGILDGLLAG